MLAYMLPFMLAYNPSMYACIHASIYASTYACIYACIYATIYACIFASIHASVNATHLLMPYLPFFQAETLKMGIAATKASPPKPANMRHHPNQLIAHPHSMPSKAKC